MRAHAEDEQRDAEMTIRERRAGIDHCRRKQLVWPARNRATDHLFAAHAHRDKVRGGRDDLKRQAFEREHLQPLAVELGHDEAVVQQGEPARLQELKRPNPQQLTMGKMTA